MASTASLLFWSFVKGSGELLVNVVSSGVLEALFPPFDKNQSPWWNLLEGGLEITLYLLVAGTTSAALAESLAGYPLAQIPYGALLLYFLLDGAMAKVQSFVDYISIRLGERRARFFAHDVVERVSDQMSDEQ